MEVRSREDMLELGERTGKTLGPGSVVALTGTLGAGKTVFVKGIARALGIEEEITSPTFTLISVYEGTLPLYHMDLYRVGSIEEFELLGADEMLYGEGVSVIEWSEKAEAALPPGTLRVHIDVEADGSRTVEIKGAEV